jgi:hypothetical protein
MPTGTLNPPQAAAQRRCEVVPRVLAGELLRPRLIELLARRWEVSVSEVVAGAGCEPAWPADTLNTGSSAKSLPDPLPP